MRHINCILLLKLRSKLIIISPRPLPIPSHSPPPLPHAHKHTLYYDIFVYFSSDYSELPEAISSCARLKTLKFIGGKYPDLPTLKGCTLLENLYINRISIRDIPSTFALLQNLVTLNITGINNDVDA